MAIKDIRTMRSAVRDWISVDEKRLPDIRLDGLINDILVDLSRRADLSAYERVAELSFITSSSDLMDGEAWPLEEIEDSTVVQYRSIAAELPSDFSRPHSVMYMSGETPVYLEQVSFEEFQDTYKSIEAGYPEKYAIWGDKIYLGPAPMTDLSISLYYMADPETLGTDAGSGEVETSYALEKYWDLILVGACSEVCKYNLEDNRYALFKTEYEAKVRRLLIQEARRLHSGRRVESELP